MEVIERFRVSRFFDGCKMLVSSFARRSGHAVKRRKFVFHKPPDEQVSRKGAKTQRLGVRLCIFAPLRDSFPDCCFAAPGIGSSISDENRHNPTDLHCVGRLSCQIVAAEASIMPRRSKSTLATISESRYTSRFVLTPFFQEAAQCRPPNRVQRVPKRSPEPIF